MGGSTALKAGKHEVCPNGLLRVIEQGLLQDHVEAGGRGGTRRVQQIWPSALRQNRLELRHV